MSGKARARARSHSPSPGPKPLLPSGLQLTGRRRGSSRPLGYPPGQPTVPESFDAQVVKTLVIITCHSDACECTTGECFDPTFTTPYDLLFTSNYGCPTITYGSFFDVARNLFEKIRDNIIKPHGFTGGVLTRAIYKTVSIQNLGKDPDGDWLGIPGTLGRSTNLKFHGKKKEVSNLVMFGRGTNKAQNVNGVYVFHIDKENGLPIFHSDDEIRRYNILNNPEVLAELKIKKNLTPPTESPPGLFHYSDSTYSPVGGGFVTLKFLLNGLENLKDDKGRPMVPPDGALVIPLTCRILQGERHTGKAIASPTASQYSQASSESSASSASSGDDSDKVQSVGSQDSLFDSPRSPGGGGGGGGKTRRHIRRKLTKKYRPRSRSRSRSRLRSRSKSKPNSTKNKSRK
jgi:hypothetical protein